MSIWCGHPGCPVPECLWPYHWYWSWILSGDGVSHTVPIWTWLTNWWRSSLRGGSNPSLPLLREGDCQGYQGEARLWILSRRCPPLLLPPPHGEVLWADWWSGHHHWHWEVQVPWDRLSNLPSWALRPVGSMRQPTSVMLTSIAFPIFLPGHGGQWDPWDSLQV